MGYADFFQQVEVSSQKKESEFHHLIAKYFYETSTRYVLGVNTVNFDFELAEFNKRFLRCRLTPPQFKVFFTLLLELRSGLYAQTPYDVEMVERLVKKMFMAIEEDIYSTREYFTEELKTMSQPVQVVATPQMPVRILPKKQTRPYAPSSHSTSDNRRHHNEDCVNCHKETLRRLRGYMKEAHVSRSIARSSFMHPKLEDVLFRTNFSDTRPNLLPNTFLTNFYSVVCIGFDVFAQTAKKIEFHAFFTACFPHIRINHDTSSWQTVHTELTQIRNKRFK